MIIAAFIKGWLSARPELDGKPKPYTNAERLEAIGEEIEAPDLSHGAGLMRAAVQLGWLQPTGMGDPAPIPLVDILPALGARGSPIETWQDASTVARMCAAFYNGLQDGKDPLSIPPWERG